MHERKQGGSDPPCDLFCGKTVNGFTVIGLAVSGDRLGPAGMMQGIGIELGLQGDAAALAITDAVLAVFIQEIAGVELDAWAVGVDCHGAAGSAVAQDGAGIAEDFPVVVIAGLQMQRLVVAFDIPADSLGGAEVHGRSVHAA